MTEIKTKALDPDASEREREMQTLDDGRCWYRCVRPGASVCWYALASPRRLRAAGAGEIQIYPHTPWQVGISGIQRRPEGAFGGRTGKVRGPGFQEDYS